MHVTYVGTTESWYWSDLLRAAAGRLALQPLGYAEISASLPGHPSSPPKPIADLTHSLGDAAIVRSMPPASLEQVIFRMDALAQWEKSGIYLLNAPRAMEVAIDKFLATSRLIDAGLATPATHVSQQWYAAIEGFHQLGGDVVVKPLFGGEGRGITRITDEELAVRAFKMLAQMGAVIYQQQYIDHAGVDTRILVLGDRTWGMRRRNGKDWRTNVSRGATTEPLKVTPDMADLAHRAADAVGAVFAGVDILEDRDGKRYVLEVNAVPGWKALAETLEVDIAAEILEHVRRAVSPSPSTPYRPAPSPS